MSIGSVVEGRWAGCFCPEMESQVSQAPLMWVRRVSGLGELRDPEMLRIPGGPVGSEF